MSEKLGVAILDLSTDSSKLDGGIDGGHNKLLSFGKTAAMATGLVATAAAAGGAVLLDQAAEMELAIGKAQTVFGDQLGFVQAWADENAHAMGLTTQEATSAAASFADLLIPMGFARDEAAKMSTDVVGLSGALSEWSNGQYSAAEVSKILASAMLGEREQLKSLGISISEADVKQRLLEKGQDKLTGTALQQAEAIATQELIFEKSQDAQTAYANGGERLGRIQKEATAWLKEQRDTIIRKSIPAFQALAGWVKRDVVPAVQRVADAFGEDVVPRLKEFGAFLQTEGLPLLQRFGEFFMADILPVLKSFGEEVLALWENDILPAIEGLIEIGGKVVDWVRDNWPRIMEFVEPVWEFFKAEAQNAWEMIQDIIGFISAIITGDWGKAWGKAKEIFANAVTFLLNRLRLFKDLAGPLFRLVRDVALAALRWLKDKGLELIGNLASGMLDKLRAGKDKIKDLFDLLKDNALGILGRLATGALAAGKDILGNFWEGLKFVKDNILDWLGTTGSFGAGLLAKLGSLAVDALTKGKDILGNLWDGLKFVKDNILDWLGTTGSFGAGLLAKLGSLAVDALTKGKDILGNLWDGLKFVKDNILDWLGTTGSFGAGVLGALARVALDALTKGKDILTAVWNGVKAIKDSILGWLGAAGEFGSGLLSKLGELGTGAYEKGREILNRLWDGLKALWEEIKSWLGTLNPLDYLPDLPIDLPWRGVAAPGGGGPVGPLATGGVAGTGAGGRGVQVVYNDYSMLRTASDRDLERLAAKLGPFLDRRGTRKLTATR